MKSLLFTIVSVLFSVFSHGQEQYASIGANSRELEQPMFYYNSLVLIQKQEITEASLKLKLQGKWRNVGNKKWEFMFWNDDKNLKFTGIESRTGDTVSCGYSIYGLTDTVKNWDNYQGTGFYIENIDERVIESNYRYPINELKNHPGLKVRDYHYPTEYIIDNQVMVDGGINGYKILEIYDNTIILSSFLDEVFVFTRVN